MRERDRDARLWHFANRARYFPRSQPRTIQGGNEKKEREVLDRGRSDRVVGGQPASLIGNKPFLSNLFTPPPPSASIFTRQIARQIGHFHRVQLQFSNRGEASRPFSRLENLISPREVQSRCSFFLFSSSISLFDERMQYIRVKFSQF